MPDPRYPALYQVNIRVWLTELSRALGRSRAQVPAMTSRGDGLGIRPIAGRERAMTVGYPPPALRDDCSSGACLRGDRLDLTLRCLGQPADVDPQGTPDTATESLATVGAIDSERTLLHLRYSFGYGFQARFAMGLYLATSGRNASAS